MSQGSYNVPTGGSESAVTFAGQCNTAWNALASKNSGVSAPTNGPGVAAITFQDWMDLTNPLFPVWKVNDGTNFDRIGTIDVANSIFCPQLGGGLTSLVNAATLDLGAQPQTLISIGGGTTAVTSFGSAGKTGEFKICYVSGAFTLTNSATIICPGGANIACNAGDMFWAFNDGGGVWLVLYNRNSAAPGMGKPTGELFAVYGTGSLPGAVRANSLTIGNTGSNATESSGPALLNLYTKIWNASAADPEILFYTSAGVLSTRGASAAADWAALKAITTPDMRGRAPFGLDAMGNSAALRLTSATMSPDGITLGAVGGAQTRTLVTANMAAHIHAVFLNDPGHFHYGFNNAASGSDLSGQLYASYIGSFVGNYHMAGTGNTPGLGQTSTITTGMSVRDTSGGGGTANQTTSIGSGTALSIMPPAKAFTWYLAL